MNFNLINLKFGGQRIVDFIFYLNRIIMRFSLKTSFIVLLFLALTSIFHSCNKQEVPTLTTSPVTNITETTALSGGTITSDGGKSVISRGVCWSENPTPTIKNQITSDGAGGGAFISEIICLYGGTNYFLRAYATNELGTGYGMVLAFNTPGEPPSAPITTTKYATNLLFNSATLNGTVNAKYYSSAASFEYGITKSYGNIINAKQTPITGSTNTSVGADISGLTAGTTYHFRVKAVNSLGASLGNDVTFKTHGQTSTDTINTLRLYSNGEYYAIGFSFSIGKRTSMIDIPIPDIVIANDGPNLFFWANNYSFHKAGEFADESSAKAAFDNLKSVNVLTWEDLAYPIRSNQIWLYRSLNEYYTKIRIISIINEIILGSPFSECVFEWVYQPDGSLTFPVK